jgi:hypothetical protein
VHLFKPGDAVRVRRNLNTNTPFPREVPHAFNPPSGAIVDYTLAQAPAGDVTLDVLDPSGRLVRHLSSAGEPPVAEAARPTLPNFWEATQPKLTAAVGGNRAEWDLRYAPPKVFAHSYETAANPGLTPPSPEGPLAAPGTYTLRLTSNGRTVSQSVTVTRDPRSVATAADIAAQHALQMKIVEGLEVSFDVYRRAMALKAAAHRAVPGGAPAEVTTALAALDSAIDSVAGDTTGAGQFQLTGGPAPAPKLVDVNVALVLQLKSQDYADQAPTPAMVAGWKKSCEGLGDALKRWRQVGTDDLARFTAVLERSHIAAPFAFDKGSPAPLC